jgi:hypothetical protein
MNPSRTLLYKVYNHIQVYIVYPIDWFPKYISSSDLQGLLVYQVYVHCQHSLKFIKITVVFRFILFTMLFGLKEITNFIEFTRFTGLPGLRGGMTRPSVELINYKGFQVYTVC